MKFVYEISFLYDAYDCFFYLNKKNLELKLKDDPLLESCYEINSLHLSKRIYCTFNSLPKFGLNDNQIGVNYEFARLLGLDEGEFVMTSKISCSPLTSVTVSPKDAYDYDLIVKHGIKVENSLLNQVKVVARDQVVLAKLFSNVKVCLKVERLEPELPFGLLQQKTELEVSKPSESNEKLIAREQKESTFSIYNIATSILKRILFVFKIYHFLRDYLFSRRAAKETKALSCGKGYTSYLNICRISTDLINENDCRDQLRNRIFLLQDFPSLNTSAEPFSSKIICRIRKVVGNPQESDTCCDESKLVSMVSSSKNFYNISGDVCCPDSIMENLNLKLGSFITIEKANQENLMNYIDSCNSTNTFQRPSSEEIAETSFGFSIKMKGIYHNVIRTVLDNIKYNQKVNTLICGDTGAGKTYYLESLLFYFKRNFFHCEIISLKEKRMTKIEVLRKAIKEVLDKSCRYQPSILFIDDIDAIMVQEDENQYGLLYTERVGVLLNSLLASCQRNHVVYFIGTCCSLSSLRSISTERGPLLFHVIHEISDLDVDEREGVLRKFILERYESTPCPFIRDIAYETKGYNIQDLLDLVEMASFNYYNRDKSDSDSSDFIQKSDFELALTEKVPLSLCGANLTRNVNVKWELVGGMEEPKRLLKEIFDWPLRYKEIYSSSPLRLQCGVLLYGVPGTGKTLLAGAVANECGLNFISVKGPEIFSKYVGASEEGIRNLFIRARKAKPCLLFFDEFDSIAPQRGTSNMDVNDRVVNQILTELDGVEELTGVFVLAATSRPDLLDPALLRPGRIDKAVHCALPTEKERLSILKAVSGNLQFSDDVDLGKLAEMAQDYTGADLRAVLYAAQTAMIKEFHASGSEEPSEEFVIENKHLLAGLSNSRPAMSAEDKEMYKSIYNRFLESRLGGATQKPQENGPKVIFA